MQHQPKQLRLARFAITLCLRPAILTNVEKTFPPFSSAAHVQYHGTSSFSHSQFVKKHGGGRGVGDVMGEEALGVLRKPRVVIVGAGMAGIAAAQRLQQQLGAGRFDLKILEASNRIGGRICSSEFKGEGVELGATWIHGIEGSPLYNMALQIGAMHSAERAWEGKDGFLDNILIKAEGGLEVAPELVAPVVDVYKQLLQEAQEPEAVEVKEMVGGAAPMHSTSVKITESSNCSNFGAFLQQGLDTFLARKHHHPSSNHQASITCTQVSEESFGSPWTTTSLQQGCFKMHENLERNITSADDLYDIDLEDYNEYWEFPGEHKTIASGYSSIVDAFASSLPPDTVQFGKAVEKIVWKESCPYVSAPVSIHCEGGSVVEADHVILTVSLGVLKAKTLQNFESESSDTEKVKGENQAVACPEAKKRASSMVELFDPPLPKWKLKSISRLGFGVVDKVFVQNEPAVEGRDHKVLQFIFDPREGKAQKEGEQPVDSPSWMRKTHSLYPINKKSQSLVAWFAGSEALQVESLTDEEILNGVSNTLINFGIPLSQQGTFLDIRRSSWGTNPLFRGSYSYVKVGATGQDIDVLAEPLPKLGDGGFAPLQILFAGEATHRHYYSTTHGAYFSGLREAERLLQHYGLLT